MSSSKPEPMVDIWEYCCRAGHRFVDITAPDDMSPYSYARPRDILPNKPEGGVCAFCNASIYLHSVRRGVSQTVAVPFAAAVNAPGQAECSMGSLSQLHVG